MGDEVLCVLDCVGAGRTCRKEATHFWRYQSGRGCVAVCDKHNFKAYLFRESYESLTLEEFVIFKIMDD